MAVRFLSKSTIAQGLPRGSKFWDGISFDGAYDSIATVTVGAGNAVNAEFTSIPSTYTHLQIRAFVRNTTQLANMRIQFNSDTASNYSWHDFWGDGASTGSGASTNASYMYAGNQVSSSSIFTIYNIDILDYANTNKYKTVRTLSGYDTNGGGVVGLRSGNWRSTSAITSIKLYPGTDSFAQYSHFALYGIRG